MRIKNRVIDTLMLDLFLMQMFLLFCSSNEEEMNGYFYDKDKEFVAGWLRELIDKVSKIEIRKLNGMEKKKK